VVRRKFFSSVAGTDTLILPIQFPAPTAGLITAQGDGFDYNFKRDWSVLQIHLVNPRRGYLFSKG
jgi:hypothetical protein